jgi:putative membrane protein
MWFGWGFFFIPLCLIFGAIAIWYFIVASKNNCHSHYTPRYKSTSRAVEILAERYARGEINKEEYVQTRKELER